MEEYITLLCAIKTYLLIALHYNINTSAMASAIYLPVDITNEVPMVPG